MKRNHATLLFQLILGVFGFLGLYIILVVIPHLWEGYLQDIHVFTSMTPLIFFGSVSSIPFFFALYQLFRLTQSYGNETFIAKQTPQRMRVLALCAFIEFLLYTVIVFYTALFKVKLPFEGIFFVATILLISLFISLSCLLLASTIEEAYRLKRDGELTI